jgi:hypothetical protein
MSLNLTTYINYLERSNALKEIQEDYAKARDGQVDLKRTAAKLQYLVIALDHDIAAINQGAKISPELLQVYLSQREELKAAIAKIHQTEPTTNDHKASRWVKPLAYTAFAFAVVGAAYLANSYWSLGTGASIGTTPRTSVPTGTRASTGTTRGTSVPAKTSAPMGTIESLADLDRTHPFDRVNIFYGLASRGITQILSGPCSSPDGQCIEGLQFVQRTLDSISSLLTFRNVALLTIGFGAVATTIIWPTAVTSGMMAALGTISYLRHRVRRYFMTPGEQNAHRILDVVRNAFALNTLNRISRDLLDATTGCVICQQQLLPHVLSPILDVALVPGCGHLTHATCLNNWIANAVGVPTCVVCRTPINNGFHSF